MPGKFNSPNSRAGAAAPGLELETDDLFVASNDTPVENAETEAAREDKEDNYILTLREELELFGVPPPEPRGLPTGRPRRQIKAPVGLLPTTNDRYLNPKPERYVPPRDPNNSPFTDIPFTAQTENYHAPRRRASYAITRRRSSAIHKPNGLPPLPRPLQDPSTSRRRASTAARTRLRRASAIASASASASGSATSTTNPSSASDNKANDSTAHPGSDYLA